MTAQTDDGDGAEPSAADGPAPKRQLVDSAWLGLVEGCKETGTYALVGPKPWSVTQRHYSFSQKIFNFRNFPLFKDTTFAFHFSPLIHIASTSTSHLFHF